jgi:hypothetical protein
MMMKDINLLNELNEAEQHPRKSSIIDWVNHLLSEESAHETRIMESIGQSGEKKITLSAEGLDQRRIFSEEAIRQVAVTYRLRFLSSHLFKSEIPKEAIQRIKQLEKASKTELTTFYLLAPAKQFQLSDCNEDPLLFAPLTDGRFYLVHQWGTDLKWYRKISKFPMQSIGALAFTVLAAALLLSLLLPTSFFDTQPDAGYFSSGRLVFFIWINLLMAAVLSYVFFAFNFTFSKSNWKSRFFND